MNKKNSFLKKKSIELGLSTLIKIILGIIVLLLVSSYFISNYSSTSNKIENSSGNILDDTIKKARN